MAKDKAVFVCNACGQDHPKWQGRCSSCGEWNTLVEMKAGKTQARGFRNQDKPTAHRFGEVDVVPGKRITSGDAELDRVLGGGLVPGSLILLGGEPGLGKSTLMLQALLQTRDRKTLLVCGEESPAQVKDRALRLGIQQLDTCWLLDQTSLDGVFQSVEELGIDTLVLDSIQTIYDSALEQGPGSVAQIRECTSKILQFIKSRSITCFLIGHVTKEGAIAGPKMLEHMVDVVLYLEGESKGLFRLLRCPKNRFGHTHELGVYEMTSRGLLGVSDPSRVFLPESSSIHSGSCLTGVMDGSRMILLEIQALVVDSSYSVPQRVVNGFDPKRLSMLIAVLERRIGLRFSQKDVFLNVTSGFKVEDPLADLAVVLALVGSLQDIVVPRGTIPFGEVGLGGELRKGLGSARRAQEALRLGFDKVIGPLAEKEAQSGIEHADTVLNALSLVFG